MTEAGAKAAGYDVTTAVCVVDDKAHYYPGASPFMVKMIAETESRRLLGIQVLGAGAVDKMVDVAVTGIFQGMKLQDFDTLTLPMRLHFPRPFIRLSQHVIFWKISWTACWRV